MSAPRLSHDIFYHGKILLADSDIPMRSLLGEYLSKLGFEVFTALTGREAIDIARKNLPDLIILEIDLPELSGLDVCQQLKDDPSTREIVFFFLTAKDDTDTKVRAFQVGADDFLAKPFIPRELEVRVLSAFRRKLPEVSWPPATTVTAILNEESPHMETTRDIPSPTKNKDPFRLIGTVLNGKYELTEFAGSGGMGAVYRSVNLTNGETVAVKILQPHIVAKSPEYADLFEREAKNAQGLSHPHIVKVFDSGKDEDLSYMVMEWVEGRSVEDEIIQGLLPLDRLTNIFGQVCSAVAFAHERYVIHLDLKPGNMLLLNHMEPNDFIKVIDFGLSRVISKESGTTVTKFRGTHQFCAPEQFGGRVSHRSDIYSLGATLYYLIAGVIPFGTSYINAKMHPNLDLPDIPSITRQRSVPSEIDFVIKKALNKNPNLRQQSALELFEEFKAALRDALLVPDSDVYYTISFKGNDAIAQAFGDKLVNISFWTWRHAEKDGHVEIDVVSQASNIENLFWAVAGSLGVDLTNFLIKKRIKEPSGPPVESVINVEGNEEAKAVINGLEWNDPQAACSLLSHISGFQTGTYKSTGVEGDFFCCSPYKDLDHDSPMPNNIAYYAEGDEERVNRLELVLNVHETQKAEAAHRALMTYSNELAYKALGEELRPKMQDAILAGRPYAYMVGELFVELKVEAWVTERGYDIKFIITQPIKISSPLKATDSQEVTTPISLPNFIESDSKDNSRARLPTSNLDYEPDETAIRILDFLAEPQHQTVYAVEIGNSLGLPQALVKSYLDKMAEEDYVLITRDNRTNSDVCTITQKGKKFLDKPVSETVNNQIEAVQERVEVTREYVENIANSLSDFEVELLSLFEGNQVLTLTEVLKRFPNIDGKRTRHTIKQLINKGLLESRTSVGTSQEIVKRVDMLKRPEIHHEPSASIVRSAVSLPEPDGEANAHSRLSPEYTCHTCGAAVAADEHDERAWRCSKCGASDQWWD